MPPTATLAAHLARISAGTVPETVRDRAGLALADTLGAMVVGQGDAAVAAAARRHATGGSCRLPGTALRAAPPGAAFLHGVAGTALELDVGNYLAGTWPAGIRWSTPPPRRSPKRRRARPMERPSSTR